MGKTAATRIQPLADRVVIKALDESEQMRGGLYIPVSPDAHARWEVRLTGVWTRTFWREPDDVARGRAGAAPSTIFGWR